MNRRTGAVCWLCVMTLLLTGCGRIVGPFTSDTGTGHLPSQAASGASAASSAPCSGPPASAAPTEGSSAETRCRLIIGGRDVSDACSAVFYDELGYAELPLTAVLRELGATVVWQEESLAQVWIRGEEYRLHAAEGTMYRAGDTVNLLAVAPGSGHGTVYRRTEGELMIDSDSAKGLIVHVVGAAMRVGPTERAVYIDG